MGTMHLFMVQMILSEDKNPLRLRDPNERLAPKKHCPGGMQGRSSSAPGALVSVKWV